MTHPRWLALGLVSSLAACASSAPIEAAPPRDARTAASPPAPATPSEGSGDTETLRVEGRDVVVPRVHLLDAGAEPRVPLRWHPAPDHSLKVILRNDSSSTSLDGARSFDQHVQVEVIVDTKSFALPSDGIRVLAVVRDVRRLDTSNGPDSRSRYAGTVGQGVFWDLSSRGQVLRRGAALQGHDDDDALKKLLGELAAEMTPTLVVPLPSEAVGTGARWRVRTTPIVDRMHYLQETVYTLAETFQPSGRPPFWTLNASVARTPLIDARGFIDAGDTERATAALAAATRWSFDELARRSNVEMRGTHLALVANVMPLIGLAQLDLSAPFEGRKAEGTPNAVEVRGTMKRTVTIHVLTDDMASPSQSGTGH